MSASSSLEVGVSLLVSGIPAGVKLIEVERHFLHQNNGGCGDLESSNWDKTSANIPKGTRSARLTFRDASTIRSILRQIHVLKGSKLTLNPAEMNFPEVPDMLRVLSQKGRSHYLHEGYLYRLTHTCAKTQVRTFRCVKRICAARLKRDGDGTFVSFGAAHNHLADPAELYRKAVMNDLKEMATDTVKPPAEIIQSATEGLSKEIIARLPQATAMRKLIGRKRDMIRRSRQESIRSHLYGDHVKFIPGSFDH